MWRWHWLKKGKKEGQEKKEKKKKRRKREKGNKKKKKRWHLLALARQRKQEHGDHQPPSPGDIPAGPFNPSPSPVDFFFSVSVFESIPSGVIITIRAHQPFSPAWVTIIVSEFVHIHVATSLHYTTSFIYSEGQVIFSQVKSVRTSLLV